VAVWAEGSAGEEFLGGQNQGGSDGGQSGDGFVGEKVFGEGESHGERSCQQDLEKNEGTVINGVFSLARRRDGAADIVVRGRSKSSAAPRGPTDRNVSQTHLSGKSASDGVVARSVRACSGIRDTREGLPPGADRCRPMNSPTAETVRADDETETFLDAYCRLNGCAEGAFLRRIFWQAIYPHARLVALVCGRGAEYFEVDRALITYCGRLTSLRQIDQELKEFASLRNRGFLRRQCRIRVSGRRLRRLAARCLGP
jgi:hypothetical protein